MTEPRQRVPYRTLAPMTDAAPKGAPPMLSMTTDYAQSTGDPSPHLRRIAHAGFSHVHWCHQWKTDFLYANCEVVIMHAGLAASPAGTTPSWDPLRQSLDDLEPCARKLGVRLAIENGDWALIHDVLGAYPPDYIGLCYDSGHGNVSGNGLAELASTKDRLISIHLHDNNGTADQHRLPFSGTVDWARVVTILCSSAYAKCINMESIMGNDGVADEEEFLAKAFAAGSRLSALVAEIESGLPQMPQNRAVHATIQERRA